MKKTVDNTKAPSKKKKMLTDPLLRLKKKPNYYVCNCKNILACLCVEAEQLLVIQITFCCAAFTSYLKKVVMAL